MTNPTWITHVLMDLAMQAEREGLADVSQIITDAMVNVSLVTNVTPSLQVTTNNVIELNIH